VRSTPTKAEEKAKVPAKAEEKVTTPAKEKAEEKAEGKKTDCSHCLPLAEGEGHLDVRLIRCNYSGSHGCRSYKHCEKMAVPDGVSPEGLFYCAEHREGGGSGHYQTLPWQEIKTPNSACAMDPKVMEKRAELAERVLPYVTAQAQRCEAKKRRWLARIALMSDSAEAAGQIEALLRCQVRKGVALPQYKFEGSDDDADDYHKFNPKDKDTASDSDE
jgi:hypothetical protein